MTVIMKGRKAVPNKILELRGGSAHTHRAPRNEPNPLSQIPSCPSHLSKESKKEWRRVVKLLDSVGILTELDRSTLAEYCESYGKWINLKQELSMIIKINIDNKCELKNITMRIEQYRVEYKRWHESVNKNEKGIVYKKENGEPAFSPYLRLERESADKLFKIERGIKIEIREAEDRMIKTGILIGMSPSSRASLSIHQAPLTEAQGKTEKFRKMKHRQ